MKISFVCVAAALASVAASSPALAQSTCVPKEYAQYKDLARTRDGRHDLALDYCLAELRSRGWSAGSRQNDQCRSEASKILQVLQQHHEKAAIKYAENGCKGDHPLR